MSRMSARTAHTNTCQRARATFAVLCCVDYSTIRCDLVIPGVKTLQTEAWATWSSARTPLSQRFPSPILFTRKNSIVSLSRSTPLKPHDCVCIPTFNGQVELRSARVTLQVTQEDIGSVHSWQNVGVVNGDDAGRLRRASSFCHEAIRAIVHGILSVTIHTPSTPLSRAHHASVRCMALPNTQSAQLRGCD